MCKYFKNVLYRIIQIIWMNYVDIFVRISKIVCINQDFYPNHLNHTIFYPNHVIFLSKTNSEIIRTDFFFFEQPSELIQTQKIWRFLNEY